MHIHVHITISIFTHWDAPHPTTVTSETSLATGILGVGNLFSISPREFGRRKLLNYVGVCYTRMFCSAQTNRPCCVQSFHKYICW